MNIGQVIQESPWKVTFESVIGYEFVKSMQIKKTKMFPPTKESVPIIGWYRYGGASTLPERKKDFFYLGLGSLEVEYVAVDIPDEQVILSDAFVWTSIMSGENVWDNHKEKRKVTILKKFDTFEKTFTIWHSWEKAFGVNPDADFILESFWQINSSWVLEKDKN